MPIEFSSDSQQAALRQRVLQANLLPGAIHRINNLLIVLQTSGEYLRDQLEQSGQPLGILADMEGAAEQIASCIERLHRFAAQQPGASPLDPGELIARLREAFEMVVSRSITLSIADGVHSSPLRIADDPLWIQWGAAAAILVREALPAGGAVDFSIEAVPTDDADDDLPWIALTIRASGNGRAYGATPDGEVALRATESIARELGIRCCRAAEGPPAWTLIVPCSRETTAGGRAIVVASAALRPGLIAAGLRDAGRDCSIESPENAVDAAGAADDACLLLFDDALARDLGHDRRVALAALAARGRVVRLGAAAADSPLAGCLRDLAVPFAVSDAVRAVAAALNDPRPGRTDL